MFYTSGSQLSPAHFISLPYLTGQVQFMHLFGNELMIQTRCLNMETMQNMQFRYRCISINKKVVEKFIYFSNSNQILKLVY